MEGEREMAGPTYKRREVKGGEGKQGEGGSHDILRVLPGSRGARIVTVNS